MSLGRVASLTHGNYTWQQRLGSSMSAGPSLAALAWSPAQLTWARAVRPSSCHAHPRHSAGCAERQTASRRLPRGVAPLGFHSSQGGGQSDRVWAPRGGPVASATRGGQPAAAKAKVARRLVGGGAPRTRRTVRAWAAAARGWRPPRTADGSLPVAPPAPRLVAAPVTGARTTRPTPPGGAEGGAGRCAPPPSLRRRGSRRGAWT